MSNINETYTYHLGVYSKLIRGRDPNGAIKRGTEARVNGRTDSFPPDLHSLCRPSLFFVGEPLITDVDPRLNWGGVFVYQPIQIGGIYYSAFARVQARSESGLGLPGRKFTHCAVIFVEEKWEPGLIKWATEMLFTKIHGGRCWGDPITEIDSNSQALPVPVLSRAMIKDGNTGGSMRSGEGSSDMPIEMQVRGRMSGLDTPDNDVNDGYKSPYPELASQIADNFSNHSLRVEGRWLNLAFGIGIGVEAQGPGGFFVRFDARKEDRLSPPKQLLFDDCNRARRFRPIKSLKTDIGIHWSELKGSKGNGPRFERLTNENILWPDQISYVNSNALLEPNIAAPMAPPMRARSLSRSVLDIQDDDVAFVWKDPASAPLDARHESRDSELPPPPYLNKASAVYSEVNHLSYDKIFDRVSVGKIRAAFRQIVGRCQLLDAENGYDKFDISLDFEKFSEAIQHLVEYVCIYATLADPDKLRVFLDDLCQHTPIPILGLPATSRGGLVQFILSATFDIITQEIIHEWIAKQHRIEMNLRIQKVNSHEIDQNYQVYNPQRQRFDAFFLWFGEIDFSWDKDIEGFSSRVSTDIMRDIEALVQVVATNVCEKWNLTLPDSEQQ